MKKAYIILIIICLSSFIVSGIMFSLAIGSIDFDSFSKDIEGEYYSAFNGKNITISGTFNNLDIVPYDENDIKVAISGNYKSFIKKDAYLDMNETTNALQIELKYNKYLGFISFGPLNSNIDLKVYIPRNYNGSITIDAVSRIITTTDLNLSNLDIRCLSGDINVLNVNTKAIDIEGVSGRIVLDNITGDVELNTLSGDVFIKYLEFNNKIDIESASSSINIDIPKGSDFILYIDEINDVKYYVDNIRQQYLRTGTKNPININSLSGEVIVNEY